MYDEARVTYCLIMDAESGTTESKNGDGGAEILASAIRAVSGGEGNDRAYYRRIVSDAESHRWEVVSLEAWARGRGRWLAGE
jgi:hypothetical protein